MCTMFIGTLFTITYFIVQHVSLMFNYIMSVLENVLYFITVIIFPCIMTLINLHSISDETPARFLTNIA